MKINNPYSYDGIWLKGNLHTHTKNSKCGHYSLEDVIKLYTSYRMAYDFIAITDHYYLTDISEFENREDILLFRGVEFKRKNSQTLGINIRSYEDDLDDDTNHQDIFNKVSDEGGINIICHPHVNREDYWSLERLLKLDNYIGIEVYNNNVRMDNSGRAIASDIWDGILSEGRKVYGFANDDMHLFSRVGGAFNMVLAKEKTKESIIEAIKRGSFYATSGVILENIKIENNIISLEIQDKRIPTVRFRFITRNGKVLKEVIGQEASYKIKGYEEYIRVEVEREDGVRAWLQPIYIEK